MGPTEDPYEGLNIKIKEWEPSDNFDFNFGGEKEDELNQKEEQIKDDPVQKTSSNKKEIKIPWPKRPKLGDFRSRYEPEEEGNEYKNSFIPNRKKDKENDISQSTPRRFSLANRNKDMKANEDNEEDGRSVNLKFPRR